MLFSVLLLLLGLVLLYYGAEALVGGAASLALFFGVSPLVAGLTVVAYGTSLPELVVSLRAAFADQSGMALGNIVGSNLFNVGVILGLAAVICPIRVQLRLVRFDIPLMLGISVAFAWMLWSGEITRWMGAVLFGCLILFTVGQIYFSRKKPASASPTSANSAIEAEFEDDLPPPSGRPLRDVLFVIGGSLLLALGGESLVRGGVGLAQALGVSETIIGLTIIAAGTSAPELAATIVAALRRHADIAVGNIVGSNIFNILSVAGLSAFIHPLDATSIASIDIIGMLAVSFLMLPLAWTGGKLNRWEGALLLAAYGLYLYLIWPGSPGLPGLAPFSRS